MAMNFILVANKFIEDLRSYVDICRHKMCQVRAGGLFDVAGFWVLTISKSAIILKLYCSFISKYFPRLFASINSSRQTGIFYRKRENHRNIIFVVLNLNKLNEIYRN